MRQVSNVVLMRAGELLPQKIAEKLGQGLRDTHMCVIIESSNHQSNMMPKPTTTQIQTAIASHVAAVGAVNVSLTEVALSLDAQHPGMSDKEFAEVKNEAAPLIVEVRRAGVAAIWK